MRRFVNYVLENSLLLLAGALAGLLWPNLNPSGYAWLHDLCLVAVRGTPLHGEASQGGIGLHYLVNDVLMAFFFALAGKEVWEAMLPGGSLRDLRRATLPILCAVAGMAGPAFIYLLGAALVGQFSVLSSGWAIPCATDIAFSYMIARVVFGKDHPAIPFLLLLAIVDDALGLVVLAVFYPQKAVQPLWLLLPAAAVLLGLALRRLRFRSFWWYLILPGPISWAGFVMSGLHPALGLLPIIPTLPHAHMGHDRFHWGDAEGQDAAKMGALSSCLAAVTALVAAKALSVGRFAPLSNAPTGTTEPPASSTYQRSRVDRA